MGQPLDFSLIENEIVGIRHPKEGDTKEKEEITFKKFMAELMPGKREFKRKIDVYDFLQGELSAIKWIMKEYIPRGIRQTPESLSYLPEERINSSLEESKKLCRRMYDPAGLKRITTEKAIDLIREAYFNFQSPSPPPFPPQLS